MPHKLLLFGVLCLVFLYPAPAFAYLDPGTGNALIYVVISLVTALLYYCKNMFYSLRAKLSGANKQSRRPKTW